MKLKVRVETHQITKSHKLYEFCDRKCYESKNLYNEVNYILRQRFIMFLSPSKRFPKVFCSNLNYAS
jgi:hypothetical protein